MLALWMFGVDLEHRWGKTAFYRYYFVCGVGAALTTLAVGLLPFASTRAAYIIPTVGASGAIYGLLLAYAILFPHRIIYYFIFPIPVRIYVLLAGLLVLYESARGGTGGGVAHFAHLGGLIFGYLYLSMGRGGPWAEIKYRYVKWRMNRLKKRFDVHEGGRRWDSRVH
jgi:membrane associated rhomboid family serine protease